MQNPSDNGPDSGWIDAKAPERQEILALLDDHGRPLKHSDIVERLNVAQVWIRRVTGFVFVGVGIYYTIRFVFLA